MASNKSKADALSIRKQIEKFYREREKMDETLTVNRKELHQWLADLARRADQIEGVTHILKFTHPEARGSNVRALFSREDTGGFVGTHCLEERAVVDVTGNAAALDVYKFLKLEHEGVQFKDLVASENPAFLAALSEDLQEARQWVRALAAVFESEPPARPKSHALAKQVYWPMSDGTYRVLSPLFSSSLAQETHARIQNVKFGDDMKMILSPFTAA